MRPNEKGVIRSREEVGKILGISGSWVHQLEHRAIEKMRQMLAEDPVIQAMLQGDLSELDARDAQEAQARSVCVYPGEGDPGDTRRARPVRGGAARGPRRKGKRAD